ncbi:type II toxin-antitoxin system Phd/YefM family antitoxin [Macrococcus lamae]|uniref:Antitoxin n=1 Tax=Macrococcus lamae TaxID=198484 RepID=A0A4R6BSC6_9STAP|nr:type II toxin-antitoxin system Phd/YefM family antitoxin [Macrococcus lamae]TDM06990.1 type II toxin-antitoxin system Phd/YefM family antitoxin [Macrococcus lamae]
MDIMTPDKVRENFYEVLKQVNNTYQPIIINGTKKEDSAVIVSLDYWNSIQETMYLETSGTLKTVRMREKDGSGFTNVDNIDWNIL